MEANKLSHRSWRSTLIPFVTTCSQLCRYYPLWTQRGLMALKCIYRVKRSPYLYNTRNFPPIRSGMSQTPPMQTQHPRCVPWDCKAKQTNTPMGLNKPPYRGQRSDLIPFVTTRSQPCKYDVMP